MTVRDRSRDWDGARWKGDSDGHGEGDRNGAAGEGMRVRDRRWWSGNKSERPELRLRQSEMEWSESEREIEFFEWEDCEWEWEGMRVFWVLTREFFWETFQLMTCGRREKKSSPMDSISIYKNRVHWTRFVCTKTESNELDLYVQKPGPMNSIFVLTWTHLSCWEN